MDQLRIKDLEIYAYHGLFEAEKKLGQRFLLDLRLDYDMTKAAQTGDLTSSIHYGELAQQLVEWCQNDKEDLIETVAFKLIENIFQTYTIAEKVSLELKKPWAPISLPLDTCSVKLERQKRRAFIGLGTNVGDKVGNLVAALKEMEKQHIKVLQTSSRIETEPWGFLEQDPFVNQVAEVETWLNPQDLLRVLLEIEENMGRTRGIKWGPRNIDLDVLYIGQEVIYSQDLIVPHPYAAERAFVLKSMLEIAPHFVDPQKGKKMRQLWQEVNQ